MFNSNESGINERDLQRYIEECIYSLPGTEAHRDVFSILMTGSRAMGTHRPDSDVDIDVLCPDEVYRSVQAASLAAGIIQSRSGFFCPSPKTTKDWGTYFGADKGAPHFSISSLESVQKQFDTYENPALWIWTNAKIISDPNQRFQKILGTFNCFPKEVLVNRLKYHWLMCWYQVIDVFPGHHHDDSELSAAGAALLNGIHEMQRVFFLVDGKPFPYTEKLPVTVKETRLGQRFGPLLQSWVERIVGKTGTDLPVWDRLNLVCDHMLDDQENPETRALEEACVSAIIAAGVEEAWMQNYYSNIHELLRGELGPTPL